MAQYTPNFNLYEPDSSDDFADFRTEFNNNMDIIDQNLGGGGGSGGHTIYDKDGNALAQESGLQFTGNVNVSDDSVNGRTVVDILGGGGAVYGAFIDTTRIIASGNIPQGSSTYTATEDCALLFTILSDSNNSAKIEIDGVKAWEQYDQNGINSFANFLLVRSGQTVTFTQSYSSNGNYKAYGLLQGTNGIYAPVIYSDTERVIGVWRDNKPLYQKTVVLTSGFSTNMTVSHGISNLERVVYVQGTLNNDIIPFTAMENNTFMGQWSSSITGMNASNFKIYIGSDLVQYVSQIAVTLRYTKTTDVAGSGNWNTDGVPTHHYSTSEQVVGTWINNKPLYEKTVELTSLEYDTNWHDRTHGIADIATIVDVKAVCTTSDGYFYPVPTPRANTTLGFTLEFTATKISYLNNWVSQPDKLYVTIQYTKTTD